MYKRQLLGWRDVPVNKDMPMSPRVRAKEPIIRQVFIGRGNDVIVQDALERKLYVIRKKASKAISKPVSYTHLDVYKRQGDLSGFIQALGRAYVQAFNRRHDRRGSLWEGRYRSTVLEPHPWLLRAMVWMDSHPLRSGLAEQAGAHPWTSAAHYLGQTTARCITCLLYTSRCV